MELRRYLRIVRRRLLLIVAIVAAAAAAGYIVTPKSKTYTASTTLYVGARSINIDPRSGQVSGERVAGFDRLIRTFNVMITSRSVVNAAVSDASVRRSAGAVAADIKAEQVPSTNLIQLSVTDADPAAARGLANAISDAFVKQINAFEPGTTPTGGQTDPASQVISVYQRAALPSTPNSIGLARNVALAALFGLIAAGALVALLEALDISIRSPEDVERRLELPVLGVVPALGNQLPVTPALRVRGLPTRRQPSRQGGSPVA
jgi:capsular polysaccharide biosynthesis protein